MLKLIVFVNIKRFFLSIDNEFVKLLKHEKKFNKIQQQRISISNKNIK